MSIEEILIPGVFDLWTIDHRQFVSRCLEAALEHGCKNVCFALASDLDANRKGQRRPLFSYDWRKQDISKWTSKFYPGFRVTISELNLGSILNGDYPNSGRIGIAVSSEYSGSNTVNQAASKFAEIIKVTPVNRRHTTDIVRLLQSTRDKSNCKIRVGSLLIRDGEVVHLDCNGGGPGSCDNCPKYLNFIAEVANSGRAEPSNVQCTYPHAEAKVLKEANRGDDILVTRSPCRECANKIVEHGIRSVVYFDEREYDLDPINILRESGVRVRKAGL